MALTLSRANRRSLASTSLIHQIISPSPLSSPLSTVPPGNDNTSSSAAGADSQPQPNTAASNLNDVKSTLREDQRSPNRLYPPARNPSGGPSMAKPIAGKGATLGSPMKNLSEFRNRSPPPSGNNKTAAQRNRVSLEDIYHRNVQDADDGGNRPPMTFDTIKQSLRSLVTKNANNYAKGDSARSWNFSSTNGTNSVGSTVISGARGGGGEGGGGMWINFEKRYSYEELGDLMKKLRPEEKQKGGGKKGSFSLQELNERLSKLKEMEEEKSSKSTLLRQGFEGLALMEEQKKQGPIYQPSILSPSPPEYTMHPPKDKLVEKYFHPDNMSSQEKMKIELAKVREEFKMNESDCGSARVQVAQLTTKIKHLSSVLHKKDKHSRKGLQEMVQRRKKLLRYLRRTDWDSFCFVLSKLGLRDNPDYKNL